MSLDACAQQLNASDDYQVLKRLKPLNQFNTAQANTPLHKVCFLDTETTGLDTTVCEVIELGYQIVEFDSQGYLYRVLESQNFLNEPEGHISAEVTAVTGLTDKDVEGHHIDWDFVASQMAEVQLIVAHNAGFDRPVVERYHDIFSQKVWGCSVAQIDWLGLAGVGSKTQEFLCWKVGQFFYDAHRALDDVQALTQLLSCPIGETNQPALGALLPMVRKAKSLVKATGAPFEIKDLLRARGYRWNADARVWQKVLDDADLESEMAWLLDHKTPNAQVLKLKATDTFSVRAQ